MPKSVFSKIARLRNAEAILGKFSFKSGILYFVRGRAQKCPAKSVSFLHASVLAVSMLGAHYLNFGGMKTVCFGRCQNRTELRHLLFGCASGCRAFCRMPPNTLFRPLFRPHGEGGVKHVCCFVLAKSVGKTGVAKWSQKSVFRIHPCWVPPACAD